MVPFSTTVVDLGVTVDSQLSMTDHISSLCRSCFYQLRQLRVIRHSLTTDAARTLVQAFITSRLDYCNSLLYGIADCQLRRLQCIQNAAARLLSGTRKFDHVSPVLRDLHWLPVRKRIFFKVATLMFKCLHGLAPSYLPHRILHISVNYRKSTSSAVCDHPAGIRAILSDYICSRSFAVSGSTVWNNLRPSSLLEILEKIICPGIYTFFKFCPAKAIKIQVQRSLRMSTQRLSLHLRKSWALRGGGSCIANYLRNLC